MVIYVFSNQLVLKHIKKNQACNPMKIACVISEIRGDVKPIVALAIGLIQKKNNFTIFKT
jgi:uncharacterized metal-binding protein